MTKDLPELILFEDQSRLKMHPETWTNQKVSCIWFPNNGRWDESEWQLFSAWQRLGFSPQSSIHQLGPSKKMEVLETQCNQLLNTRLNHLLTRREHSTVLDSNTSYYSTVPHLIKVDFV